uniref:CSON013675 protein n=1 Tax=Culicoides sonorensis TaxID=179676 RepID=A0A336LLB8_CULSO
MYSWYRDSVGQYSSPLTASIKTEAGFNDCMLALDYATQSKLHLPISIYFNHFLSGYDKSLVF